MPGTPFSQTRIAAIVDRAIADHDADRALGWTRRLEQVPLGRALALCQLLGEERDPRYRPAARRFLVRFIAEVEPALLDLKKVVDALDVIARVELPEVVDDAAEDALRDLARQLDDLGA